MTEVNEIRLPAKRTHTSREVWAMRVRLKEKHQKELSKLQSERDNLLEVIKLAYLKHCLGDESIGWNELEKHIFDAVRNGMGLDKYLDWLNKETDRIENNS